LAGVVAFVVFVPRTGVAGSITWNQLDVVTLKSFSSELEQHLRGQHPLEHRPEHHDEWLGQCVHGVGGKPDKRQCDERCRVCQ
jgi:hypothetical protein